MPKFALRYPFFIIMMCLVVLLIGVVNIASMPVDLFPKIEMPVVVVATFYNGMPPQQIEADVRLEGPQPGEAYAGRSRLTRLGLSLEHQAEKIMDVSHRGAHHAIAPDVAKRGQIVHQKMQGLTVARLALQQIGALHMAIEHH